MKQTIIFGAGQGGKMLHKLLSPEYEVIAFADRNPGKWGNSIEGVPVLSQERALDLDPDCIWISILNREVSGQVYSQLMRMGFIGEINSLENIRNCYDIRLAGLRLISEEIIRRKVLGDIAELGVYQGHFSIELNRIFPDRTLHLFDTFEGFSENDLYADKVRGEKEPVFIDFSHSSVQQVKAMLPNPENASFHKGFFPDTIPESEIKYALVSLDADLFAPTYSGLKYFYPRLSKGGAIIIHDYNSMQYLGAGEAARKYCDENGIYLVPYCDFHGSAVLVKN